ncbi:MAG: hypothetical protein ACPGU1_07105 [Myxococcota bacterium]
MGVVGARFRESLTHDLKVKLIEPDSLQAIEVVGAPGSGRHLVASVVHAAARTCLDRKGPRADFDCGAADLATLEPRLRATLGGLEGGTLVLDRVDVLGEAGQTELRRILSQSRSDTLVCALRGDAAAKPLESHGKGRIVVKPLHEREEDVWQLIAHFFTTAEKSCPLDGCRGFSRQAMTDIATMVQDTGVVSVRRLRGIVRDLVFEASLFDEVPLKLTSHLVRPYLESQFGQTREEREARQAELVASQFDALVHRSTLDRIAELHGIPPELVNRQAEVLRDVIGYIDDVPRSYRNIMDRSEDVMRAALWALSGATTQAEFRRFFGDERFMRPTKSVAWAFYNRVFKRDV